MDKTVQQYWGPRQGRGQNSPETSLLPDWERKTMNK